MSVYYVPGTQNTSVNKTETKRPKWTVNVTMTEFVNCSGTRTEIGNPQLNIGTEIHSHLNWD